MYFADVYQYELIRKMIHQPFMEQMGSLLSPEMFEPRMEGAVREVLTEWRKRKRTVSKAQLAQILRRHSVTFPDRTGQEDNFDFDYREVMDFARDRILADQLSKAMLHKDERRFDKAIQCVVEAKRLFPHSGVEVTPDILTSHQPLPTRKNPIPTGLVLLDQNLGGGVAEGELATVLAPTSGGKSTFLAYLAAQAVIRGKKIWYATLEVPEGDIRGKVQRCILRTDKPSLKAWEKKGKQLSKAGARLQIFESPPHSIGVESLDGLIPDDTQMVCVDYADYLRSPNEQPGLSYENLGYIYTTLKALALSRKIPVWTASQVHRQAYDSDEIYVQHVEASLKKVMVSDIVLSINQGRAESTPDPETHNCTGRLFLAKNRGGPRHVSIDVTVNWALTLFSGGLRG